MAETSLLNRGTHCRVSVKWCSVGSDWWRFRSELEEERLSFSRARTIRSFDISREERVQRTECGGGLGRALH